MAYHMFHAVRNFLILNHMYVEDEWLTGCVEYLTENSGNNLTITEVQNLARDQWLLNDLKDICPGCLPANLVSEIKTVLKERYVLQINAAIDIGTPAYQQYLKLQKVNMDNVEATTRHEDKVPNHRMIKLYLTDGEQDITAIEYKPMRNLSSDITPGCKVLIKGPVPCRRGVLQLTESSIELLGGDVADIAISNSLPALLSAKLGLPMGQDPNITLSQCNRNTDIPAPHTDVPSMRSFNQILEPTLEQTSTVTEVPNDIEDDIDIDEAYALEALLDSVKRPSTSGNDNPEKRLKVDTTNNQYYGNGIDLDHPTTSGTELVLKNIKVDTVNNENDYPDDIDLLIEEDEAVLRDIESKVDAYERIHADRGPIMVSSQPFVYIKQINELSESEKAGRVFKVKAQIMKLLSKLTVGKDGWYLKCIIVDGTGSLDVEFTSEVLSKLVGFTPKEMTKLKKEMGSSQQVKERVISGLQKAKDTLQVLYCVIEITILEVARITNLVQFEAAHVDLLKKRMEKTEL